MPKSHHSLKTLTCLTCGITSVNRYSKKAKYCSSMCYHNKPRCLPAFGELTCELCNSMFTVLRKRLKVACFCSHNCSIKFQQRNKILHECILCKNSFWKSPSSSIHHPNKYCSKKCQNLCPQFIAKKAIRLAQQALQSPNKFETRCYDFLTDKKISFERQVVIADKFSVDALLLDYPIIIQLDGDYWHGHPDRFPIPDARQQKRIRLDHSQNAYFKKMGYAVVRVWESEMKTDPNIL